MNKRLSVCLVITQPEWGGAQRYVYDLALGLHKKSFKVTVLTGEGTPMLPEKLREYGIETYTISSIVREISPLKDLVSIFRMRSFFKKHAFDVVHLNSSKIGISGALAAKMAHIPKTIFTAHGFVFNERIFFLKKWVYAILTWVSFRFINHVIAVSEYDRKRALDIHLISPQRIHAIHNGITYNEQKYLSRVDARLFLKKKGVDIQEGDKLIGVIANLYKNKGLEFLVDALQKVRMQGVEMKAVVIGEGKERKFLEEKIAECDLVGRVWLVGFVEDPEKYLKAFDVFVSSSLKEGLPYSLIEARAARVPIVATSVGGVPEIVTGENSILVTRGDSKELADALIQIFSQREAHVISKHRFLLEDMLSKTIAIYEK